ncbi:MAG: 30S ribosomal protein S12 methylthiotransferase RimO [Verrucomicrobia bacterium]|nr:30S ribosomal protein S12 methylthiotransferase RimO [Verrucomicrobiota bacterium]
MSKPIVRGNKIHFTSLGCARNLVDTEVMLGMVLKAGYELTGDETEADFLVINTCGFLESARQEALDTLDVLFKEKKKNAKIVVTGCMVQKHSSVLKGAFPEIHYMLGPGDVEKILEALDSGSEGESITSARSYLQWGEVPRRLSTPSHFAYLKIAEGCAKRCSFCIIPTIKGPLKSKSEEQVIKEFRSLLSQGVFEIILIAQDLGDFGKERKEKGALERLLREMLKEKGDFWIRLLYLYPDEISDELIQIMKGDGRLLPYLDMPIQHINSDILKAMRRKTNREHIITTYEKLRSQIPHSVIRTSLMVGFPGETDSQFEELVQFVKDYPLDNIGVFQFSLEKEAHAAKLPDHISDEVKRKRYEKLMKTQMGVVRKINQKYIGKSLEVMVEGYHPDSEFLMRGRFYGQCPEIDGQVIINDSRHVKEFGRLHQVTITDVIDYDLIGASTPAKPKKKTSPLAMVHE